MKSFKYLTAGLTAVALAGGISLVYAQSNSRMDSTNNTATQTADPQRDGTMQSGTASRPYNSNDTTAGTSSGMTTERTAKADRN